MRQSFCLPALLLFCAGASADAPRPPLRFVPDQADFVIQVHSPRKLLDTITGLDVVKDAQKLEAVKETLDSTQARRFFQLLGWFEKKLDATTPELLDRLAGGGAVLAGRYGDKAPVLIVVQGTDDEAMRKFVETGIELIETEQKIKVAKKTYRDVEVRAVGDDFRFAVVEGALLFSNKDDVMKASLDLIKGGKGKSLLNHAPLKEAEKLLPKDRVASFWVNMEPVKTKPEFEAFYKTPRDPFVTVVFGGLPDILGRSPAVSGAVVADAGGLGLSFRAPRGTEGMGSDRSIVAPPSGEHASRPLLQPKGMLASSSFYWDISRFWTDRVELFGKDRAKDIEAFDETSGKFLSSVRFSKLLSAVGPYHRVIAVHQPTVGYKRKPKTPSPAFAYVMDLRKPEEFNKGMETILRAAGLFTTPQYGLKMVEEKYKDCDIVGYRFDEKKELKEDPEDARFNFSPCFVAVGNQYVFCSTIELCRETIDLLKKETTEGGSKTNSRTVFASAGGKELLKSLNDQLIATSVLGQALPLSQAKAEVQAFLALFDRLDALTLDEHYGAKDYRIDLRLKLKK